MLLNALSGFGAGIGAYRAKGVYFDGSNDYLSFGSTYTNAADSKLWTLSFWFKTPNAGNRQIMLNTRVGGTIQDVLISSSGALIIEAYSTTAKILSVTSGSTYEDDAWHHAALSVDMANSANRHLLIDGADDTPTWATYTDAQIRFIGNGGYIGAVAAGTNKMEGDVADLWFEDGHYIDLSASNPFIRNGKPANLGASGQKITGSPPLIFLSGAVDEWHTNKGTGDGFTENGALTASATSPSD